MKKHTRSALDQPVGKLHVIHDFLPPPEELFPKRDPVKITMIVDRDSINFFRNQADNVGLKYQRMMRDVLWEYSHRYQNYGPTKRSSGRPHTGRR